MAPNVKFEMSAENAKVIMAMQQIIDKQRKMEDGQTRVTKASKETDDMFGKIGKSAIGMAAGMMSASGIIAAVTKLVGLASQFEQSMERASKATMSAGIEGRSLAMLINDGTADALIKDIRMKSAAMSSGALTSNVALDFFQAQYSGAKGSEQQRKDYAMRSMESLAKMTRSGAAPADLSEFIISGGNFGIDPMRAAAFPIIYGMLSKRDPAMMAKGSEMLPYFTDPHEAMAFSAIQAETYGSRFLEKTKESAAALSSNQGPEGKLYERLGVLNKSPMEKIRAMADAGLTPDELKSGGFGGQGAFLGISAAMRNIGQMEYYKTEGARQIGALTPQSFDLLANSAAKNSQIVSVAELQARSEAEQQAQFGTTPFGIRSSIVAAEKAAYVKAAQSNRATGLTRFLIGDDVNMGPVGRGLGAFLFPDIAQNSLRTKFDYNVETDMERYQLAESLIGKVDPSKDTPGMRAFRQGIGKRGESVTPDDDVVVQILKRIEGHLANNNLAANAQSE